MARVTVEDCVDKIPNRFELVMMASQRARGLSAGSQITVDRDNDKNPVVSLREIAETTVSTEDLTEELIKSLQTFVAIDEPEEEDIESLETEQDSNSGEDVAGAASVMIAGDPMLDQNEDSTENKMSVIFSDDEGK